MDGGVFLSEFIGIVAKIRDRAVLVVGAGLSVDAGGANSRDLPCALRDADTRNPPKGSGLPAQLTECPQAIWSGRPAKVSS